VEAEGGEERKGCPGDGPDKKVTCHLIPMWDQWEDVGKGHWDNIY
jgi:hypothetical protein